MSEKNNKVEGLCCKDESCNNPIICDCQGICICKEFAYDYEESKCEGCVCNQ